MNADSSDGWGEVGRVVVSKVKTQVGLRVRGLVRKGRQHAGHVHETAPKWKLHPPRIIPFQMGILPYYTILYALADVDDAWSLLAPLPPSPCCRIRFHYLWMEHNPLKKSAADATVRQSKGKTDGEEREQVSEGGSELARARWRESRCLPDLPRIPVTFVRFS